MRKAFAVFMALVMTFSLTTSVMAEQLPKSDDTVILYTNDVHTHIDKPLSYDVLSAVKDALETRYETVLLVDAGDHVQGTAYGSMDKAENIIKMMNAAGYDLATMGNHEFDYGMDGFEQVMEWADYPYVSCNFYHEEDGIRGENVLDSFKLFDCGEEQIAIIGITTPESITKGTPTCFQDDNGSYIYGIDCSGNGEGLYTDVQKAIDDARAAGADTVIALGHLGREEVCRPWTSKDVIVNTSGLDAFIDGHSHEIVEGELVQDESGRDVLLTQTGEYFNRIGMMLVDAETGAVSTDFIELDNSNEAEPVLRSELYGSSPVLVDTAVSEVKNAWIAEIEQRLGAVFGSFGEDVSLIAYGPYAGLESDRIIRAQETNAGDFCADALYYLFDNMGLDVDAAIMNGGGILGNYNIPVTGDISYMTCKNIHPYGNVACLQTVTGQQLLDALEWGARLVGVELKGSFLQVAGLTYKLDPSVENTTQADDHDVWCGPPTGDYRVYDVKVYNRDTDTYEPLDLNADYNLAGYNYTLRDLGDGFAMFDGAVNVLDYVMEDYQVLGNYVKGFEQGTVDALNSPLLAKYPGMLLDYADPDGAGRICIDLDGDGRCDCCDGEMSRSDAQAPGQPENLAVTYGDGSITLSWTDPADNGGAAIREYIVEVQREHGSMTIDVSADEAGGGEIKSCTVDDLTNAESCRIGVCAVNAAGAGETAWIDAAIPLIPYIVEVGGVRVTQENMSDVLGDGTVSYDPETRVLTLNNADIAVTEGNYGIQFYVPLRIELVGENNVSCTGYYGMLPRADAVICGDGSLNISGSDFGIDTKAAALTICGNAVVNACSGDVVSGNSFGIRSTGSLTVRENATVTAAGGGAPGTSYGIYAGADFTVCDNAKVTANGGKGAEASIGIYIYDPFVVSGNSTVTARADESAGRSCGTYPLERLDLLDSAVLDTAGSKAGNDSYGMRTTDISVSGGTLIATGGEGVYDSLGIHTQGFEIFGGSVSTNAGPASFGPSLGLRVAKLLNVSGGELTAIGGDAPAGASCGIYVGSGMTVEAGTVKAVSGSALEYTHGIETDSLTVTGGEVTAQAVAATGEEGYSWGIQAYNGLNMTGGSVSATGGSAGSRSYGIQTSGAMNITGGAVKTASGIAETAYALWSFEEMTLNNGLVIQVPVQGKVDNSGEWYWTISDAGGNSALWVEIGTPVIAGGGGSSSVPAYAPNVERTENGAVSVTPKYPNQGDKVTIKTAPEAGYMVADIVVTDKKENEVKLANNGDGTYSFIQPVGKVTINVEFIPERCLSDDYADLDPEAWYHEAVDYVLQQELMVGVGEGVFAPGQEMSRNMLVTILWSLEGKPVVNYAMSFNDVPADSWYTEAVRWAASVGIVSGYGNGGFGAEDVLTREQFASILWSYAKCEGIDVSVGEDTNILSYNDAFDISEYAIPAIQWACGAGIINGKDGGILDPKGPATRAEGAQMLMCYLLSQDRETTKFQMSRSA